MLRDGKARVDSGPWTTPKKGEHIPFHHSFFTHSFLFSLLLVLNIVLSFFVVCFSFPTAYVLQINCSLHRLQTARARAMARTGFLCRASRTLSARPLRRRCCSWREKPRQCRRPSWSQVRQRTQGLLDNRTTTQATNDAGFVNKLFAYFICSLFQMTKEGRRKRKSRRFSSALQWFTPSR